MSNVAITASQLGKSYRVGELQKYKAIRDVVADAFRKPFRRNGRSASTIWALKDVSFEIQHGQAVGLIGHNGAGKSTLLRILSRITEPSTGFARVRGRIGSLLEVGTGFHPELTGRENIFLSGAILGMKKAEIDRNFDSIVDFAEVEKFIDTPVKLYSSGMYVRLAFSVAAHLEPEILLVDEVLAVGDAAFQKKCLGKMGAVAKEGRTVVLISHNMAAIQNLCTVAHLLSRGTLIASGDVTDVVNRYLSDVATTSQESLAGRSDRQGNRRLTFEEFTAAGASRDHAVMCGAEARFEIKYRGNEPLRNVHVSMAFYNTYGEGVLYLSNELVDRFFETLPTTGSLICKFERFPLMPGSYSVNLYCTVNGVLADWVKDAARINVEDGDFYGSGKLPPKGYGAVVVPHDWMAL
jgi:lipopolysaccharide transport system ATP-binding protein